MGASQSKYIPGKFDGCHLHPQTNPEERQAMLTGITNGRDLSFDTS
jgi:hypothetical protein